MKKIITIILLIVGAIGIYYFTTKNNDILPCAGGANCHIDEIEKELKERLGIQSRLEKDESQRLLISKNHFPKLFNHDKLSTVKLPSGLPLPDVIPFSPKNCFEECGSDWSIICMEADAGIVVCECNCFERPTTFKGDEVKCGEEFRFNQYKFPVKCKACEDSTGNPLPCNYKLITRDATPQNLRALRGKCVCESEKCNVEIEKWSGNREVKNFYNSSGKIETIESFANGQLQGKTTFEYDGEGKLINEDFHNIDIGIYNKISYKYDGDKIISGKYFGGQSVSDLEIDFTATYSYFPNGVLNQIKYSDESGVKSSVASFEYDSAGNFSKITTEEYNENGDVSQIRIQSFEYDDKKRTYRPCFRANFFPRFCPGEFAVNNLIKEISETIDSNGDKNSRVTTWEYTYKNDCLFKAKRKWGSIEQSISFIY